jgi:hypothetical protein
LTQGKILHKELTEKKKSLVDISKLGSVMDLDRSNANLIRDTTLILNVDGVLIGSLVLMVTGKYLRSYDNFTADGIDSLSLSIGLSFVFLLSSFILALFAYFDIHGFIQGNSEYLIYPSVLFFIVCLFFLISIVFIVVLGYADGIWDAEFCFLFVIVSVLIVIVKSRIKK